MGPDVSRPLRRLAAVAVATALVVLLAAGPASAALRSCVISTSRMAPTTQAPPLRFGIYPGGTAGSVDPKAAPRPEDPAKRLAALEGLRGASPFVVRLYSGWTGDAQADDVSGWLDDEIREYTAAGFQVELAVRYKPADPDPAASPTAFAAYVRGIVRRYGDDAGFTSLQVTNEANLPGAPEASDGAFAGAVRALVKGVVAAKDEARRGGHDQVRVGFNWGYDERAAASTKFWAEVGRAGGKTFARSVDWVGLNSYPGTWSPQLTASPVLPGKAAAAIRNSLRTLRDCYLPMAGIGRSATLHVAENGFPTGAGRGDDMQSAVLDAMVRAVDAVRATYGVSDYRWFDLRDSSTADRSLESHYGITRDDYTPKPAYGTYRGLIAELGTGGTGTRSVLARAASCVPSRVKLALTRRAGEKMTALTVNVGRSVVKTARRRAVPRVVALSLPSGSTAVALHFKVRSAGHERLRVVRKRLQVC
jgi:hypothetical protein